MSRMRALVAVALSLAACVLVMRGCDREPADVPLAAGSDANASRAEARVAARAQAQAQAEAETALRARHDAAMRAAVSTLHRYLAQLPEDRAAADAFWIDGAPTVDADEADLRELSGPPRRLRTRNRSPHVLGGDPVPTSVRIPVELRIGVGDAPVHRYSGWYELRYVPAQEAWRITGASVDPVPPPQ